MQTPQGIFDLQEPFRASYDLWDHFVLSGNALLSSEPSGGGLSSLDIVPAFLAPEIAAHEFLENSLTPAQYSASTGSISNSSSQDTSLKPKASSVSSSRIEKRQANTLAARRYRKKRLDQVAELEAALKATQIERDALKVQVAKLQAETQILKDIVRGGEPS